MKLNMTTRVFPVVFIWLIFAAHIMRGYGPAAAVAVFLLVATLLIRNRYIPVLWQILISFAAVEWIRTTISLMQMRIVQELPYTRLLVIMSVVILLNIFGVFWMRTKKLKAFYR